MNKKDNTTMQRKVMLRHALLADMRRMDIKPLVMETHGGNGALFSRCYARLAGGVVIDKDAQKAEFLAWQRPTWAVYEGDSERLLRAGVGAHVVVNFLDLDPYGEPWSCLSAFFGSERPLPPVLAVAVNDGFRNGIKMTGWRCAALADVVQRVGQHKAYTSYLEICREKVKEIASQRGYSLARWTGYYCGHNNDITHYAAILKRSP